MAERRDWTQAERAVLAHAVALTLIDGAPAQGLMVERIAAALRRCGVGDGPARAILGACDRVVAAEAGTDPRAFGTALSLLRRALRDHYLTMSDAVVTR